MLFGQHEQLVDELFFGDVGLGLGVEGEVFVDPHSPLVARVDRNHGLCGLEKAEDVDEDFEADEYFLDEMYYLCEGQERNLLEPASYLLSSHSQLVDWDLRVFLEECADPGDHVALLFRFIGVLAANAAGPES